MENQSKISPSIFEKIEQFFSSDEKARKASLNLARFLSASPKALNKLSITDVAEAMEADDHQTLMTSLQFCSGSLGLIDTYAEIHVESLSFDLDISELDTVVRAGRVRNPRTGAFQMFSYLTHPWYKAGPALAAGR
jgi:hypothetical protein